MNIKKWIVILATGLVMFNPTKVISINATELPPFEEGHELYGWDRFPGWDRPSTELEEPFSGYTEYDTLPDWEKYPVTMYGILDPSNHWAYSDMITCVINGWIKEDLLDSISHEIGQRDALDIINKKFSGNNYKGLVHGDDRFTRAMLADVVVNIIEKLDGVIALDDDDISSLRYKDKEFIGRKVYKARLKGIMSGDTQGYFNPERNVTYGELSTVLNRIDKLVGN